MMATLGAIADRGPVGERLSSAPRWASYLITVGVVALAGLSRIWPLGALRNTLTWITFYPAVLVAAVVGGLATGLLATGLTCLITVAGWPLLVDAPFVRTRADWLGVAVFIVGGVLISALTEGMRRADRRARAAKTQTEIANQELERQRDELAEAHRQLERLSRLDSLTGLVNRAETLARLDSALNSRRNPGTQLGVLFCDIDRFKAVNDTRGHDAGDAVLWTVAERISDCLRHGDTVGRIGGDEFLVLLPGLHSMEEATRIAEKILARMVEPIRHSSTLLTATISIGVTMGVPGETVTDTTARADAAMYTAKHQGGNTVVSTEKN